MKEIKTYRDLIKAQLDGQTVQYYSNDKEEWADFYVTVSTDLRYLDNVVNKDIYRIKPTKPSIDWSHVHPDFRYLARDESGPAYLYKHKPSLGLKWWHGSADGGVSVLVHKSYKPGNCHWEDSLVERPKG